MEMEYSGFEWLEGLEVEAPPYTSYKVCKWELQMATKKA